MVASRSQRFGRSAAALSPLPGGPRHARGFLDLGIPFMLMHLYYISPKSYLLSMGAAADGKKVVHIKYCVA